MATKRKIKQKPTKSKRTASRRATPKKQGQKKKTPKKSAKRKSARNVVKKTKGTGTKRTNRKTAGAGTGKTERQRQPRGVLGFSREALTSRSGDESGDLQGLSDVESADSESVDELIEEGNPFEAGVVSGVEEAGDRSEKEVRTHEVPEDDVPGEYLDEE